MEPLLPEQKKQLASWAEQRDQILTSIADKKVEEASLVASVNNLSESKSKLIVEIHQSEGRIDELKKKEEEFKVLISAENAVLREEKARLQGEIPGLEKEIALLKKNRDEVVESISVASTLFERVFGKAGKIEELITSIVKVASDNAVTVRDTMTAAGVELQKVIDIGEQNVEKTNRLVLDIPRIIVDLHRDILERRVIARNRIASNGVPPEKSSEKLK